MLLPWLAKRERLGLLHVQRIAPPRIKAQLIVHTHDLLPITAPDDHRGFRNALVRHLTASSLRRADAILTVSNSTAREIEKKFPFASNKTVAIDNGVEHDVFRPKTVNASRVAIHHRLELTGDYILYIGAIMARKNLRVAIEGFRKFIEQAPVERRGMKLVLAGMCRSQTYADELRAAADGLPKGSIVFAGFITDAECVDLLQHAWLFLAPSRGEGFDLPALEAMACSVAVLCSDIPVHREVLAERAEYFETDRADSLADGLLKLTQNEEARLAQARLGPAFAQRYNWQSSMTKLASLYRVLTSKGQVSFS